MPGMKMTGDGYLAISFTKTFRSEMELISHGLDIQNIRFATMGFSSAAPLERTMLATQ
jgi:hypothetical protein